MSSFSHTRGQLSAVGVLRLRLFLPKSPDRKAAPAIVVVRREDVSAIEIEVVRREL